MRDILKDLESGRVLSDPDPMRRAQIQMKAPLPQRFYKTVTVEPAEPGYAVKLDGKSARTPGKAPLVLPTMPTARLVADEFEARRGTIDPVRMPALQLVDTGLDRVASDRDALLVE